MKNKVEIESDYIILFALIVCSVCMVTMLFIFYHGVEYSELPQWLQFILGE